MRTIIAPRFLLVLIIVFGNVASSADGESSGKLSGKAYFEYNHPLAEEDGFAQFRITRFYFAYDYKMSEHVSMRYRLDVDHSTELDADGAVNDKLRPFLKHGYVSIANFIPASTLYAGMQGTPNWNIPEKFWGYRSVEKTMQDRYKIGTSADVGIGLKTLLPGNMQTTILLANGTGYKHAEDDKYKKLYTQLLYTPSDLLTAALFFDYEPQNDDYANSTITAFIGTKLERFTGGIEFANRTNQDTTNLTAMGVSVFGSLDVKIGKLFLRVDQMKSDLRPGENTEELTYILGFDYNANKQVHIMPNYKSVMRQGGGNTNTARLTFEYKY